MRVLAVGDIHGCATALDALLEVVGVQLGDTWVTLGDYVDRGPDSRGVIERLIALDARDDVSLVPILGNHEQMMREARDDPRSDWPEGYGKHTLASYGGLAAVPDAHWAFLDRCVDSYETERCAFVHANAYPDCALADTPIYMLRWEFLDPDRATPLQSSKTLVCGHTRQTSGRPLDLGHTVCIDTNACGGGWLTCLEPDSGRIWQANQRGETRTGWLTDP